MPLVNRNNEVSKETWLLFGLEMNGEEGGELALGR